jgi:hypothetical protein
LQIVTTTSQYDNLDARRRAEISQQNVAAVVGAWEKASTRTVPRKSATLENSKAVVSVPLGVPYSPYFQMLIRECLLAFI